MFTFSIPTASPGTPGLGSVTARRLATGLGRGVLPGCTPPIPATPSAVPDINLIKVVINIGPGR